MGLVAASLLVFFTFICNVQCQWNQIAKPEVDFINPKGLRTLNQGLNHHKDDWSTQFRPTSAPVSRDQPHIGLLSKAESTPNRRRTRRQAKIGNAVEAFSWDHRFSIEETQLASMTKETLYNWQESTKRLKLTLENNIVFEFLNPTGLRISIPANHMRIIDYQLKLNEEFRGTDGGPTMLLPYNNYKKNGMWVYELPHLHLKQGDRVHYKMRLLLSKDQFDVTVKGVLEITKGNPHPIQPGSIQFRPTSPVLAPQTQTYNGIISPSVGGGTIEAFSWNNQFTINATYSNAFTKESASRWQGHAAFIKRFLENHIVFKFLNPNGLTISIPDDHIKIIDFRIKLNDDFRSNDDGGHFTPTSFKRDNMWTYDIPQLHVQPGDRVYYLMRITRERDGFDAMVRGILQIFQGNPHKQSSFTAPTQNQHTQPSHVNPYLTTGVGRPPVESGQPVQPLMGSGQPTTGSGQFPTGGGQSPNGGEVPPSLDRFGGPSGNGGQALNWEHKFTSINTNTTSEAGLTPDAANWAVKADEYLKKALNRDIKFQFFDPKGLRILLTGDDNYIRILDFHLKLNEEFKNFDSGHYEANITRWRDGRWSYYYPSLKLKDGDKVYYWMKVTYGKNMWFYIVQGRLEISSGDPHNNLNAIRTTPSPWPAYVETKPTMTGGKGQPLDLEHKYYIRLTNNDSNVSPQEVQLVKNKFEKDVNFKFLNPSGLSILFPGDDKDFRVLAFNIKLNEEFSTLGPGDYVANVTKTRDGRLNYYYPNLKLKVSDKVYYWMRVMVGKDLTDFTVNGELNLKQGDPHVGGPVPDVPPPNIWTRPKEPSATSSNNTPPNQTSPVQSPASQNNKQGTTTQNPIPPNNNQPPNEAPLPQTPASQESSTQTPLPQTPDKPNPLPLSANGSPPPPALASGTPTRLCAASQSGADKEGSPACPEEVVVNYNYNEEKGTHQVIIDIDPKKPFQIKVTADGASINPVNTGP